jgi:hypothetical protein
VAGGVVRPGRRLQACEALPRADRHLRQTMVPAGLCAWGGGCFGVQGSAGPRPRRGLGLKPLTGRAGRAACLQARAMHRTPAHSSRQPTFGGNLRKLEKQLRLLGRHRPSTVLARDCGRRRSNAPRVGGARGTQAQAQAQAPARPQPHGALSS